MKITIVGAGKVGEKLCIDLASEGHDIVLIEKNEKTLNRIIAQADIAGVVGNGALYETQVAAGVGESDIFIAVTPQDETNIIAAITAKVLNHRTTIARVRDPDYTTQMNFLRRKMGIGLMINPEQQAARSIIQMIQFPEAIAVDQFANGRVYVVQFLVSAGSPLVGLKMKDLRPKFSDVLVGIIERSDGQVLIPSGYIEIRAGDIIHVTGEMKQLIKFYNCLGGHSEKIRSAMIIGGGRITRYLIPALLRYGIKLKVIEKSPEPANYLAGMYSDISVVNGDGTSQATLLEQRIQDYDAVISLTGIDEENLLIGLFAETQKVPKIISKVNRINLLDLLHSQAIQSIVTPKELVADEIIRLVRAKANSEGSKVESLYRLARGKVEALQFTVTAKSKSINVPLQDLPIRPETIITYILRDRDLIFPTGQDCILPEDRVIVFTTYKNFDDLDDILQ